MLSSYIEMKGISKAFGNNVALNNVDIHLNKGEVVSILGENGAGKSTLMKILYGMYSKDEGVILYNNQELDLQSPKDAIDLGVQMVHQHFMLVEKMTVIDNVMLGKEPGTSFYYDRKLGRKIVEELGEKYGLSVPYDKKIQDISVGERQKVEILKALYQEADLLILDEPTAVLTPQEVDDLLQVITNLKKMGRTIIIITHKLKETMAISDRVYVLRDGCMVGERQISETNIDDLSELMVGHKITSIKKEYIDNEEKFLTVSNLTHKNAIGASTLNGINFSVNRQEIVGIAGVEGNGQEELISCISGNDNKWEGRITIGDDSIKNKTVLDILKLGVSVIHADRQAYSITETLDASYNYLMGNFANKELFLNKYLINWEEVKKRTTSLLEENDVRPRKINLDLGDFSGGNQQKFVVGRETQKNPNLIIAAHPTRGVDIMASSFIHNKLIELKKQGTSVLVVSSDLDEIRSICDRILVIYNGKIVANNRPDELSNMDIGRLMGGGEVGINE